MLSLIKFWLERRLQQPEIDFDSGLHRNRSGVVHAGFEAPFLDRFDRLLIEAQAERADDLKVPRIAFLVNDYKENARTLEFPLMRFLAISRLHVADQPGR